VIVATAGHIDHGKTLLVKALTGVDTDRLPEEKARGISIDLGFAYLPCAGDRVIGFVDVPGHERFIHNMLAGVSGIDFALLVVAADDGVMPQTREHLQILDLLGIRQGIAVVSKIDRVDGQRAAAVQAELRALLDTTTLSGSPVVPASAMTGAGIEPLRAALLAIAEAHRTRYREGQHFRFAVDRAFSIAGSGTVATGTVFNGEVRRGDRLIVSPGGVPVRVRGIQVRHGAVEAAQAGLRCALTVSGIDVAGLKRGDWVLHEALHAPTQRIEARFTLLASEPAPLAHWTRVHLHLATADTIARVAVAGGGAIAPGRAALAQLVLERPLAALNGDRFILRDQTAGRTLGGGTVIDPFARPARRSSAARPAVLAALELGEPAKALAALLRIPEHATDCARFETAFNLTAERAEALYRASAAARLGRERRVAIAEPCAEALRDAVPARLASFHDAEPQSTGMSVDRLQAELAPWLSADAFAFLLRGLADAQRLELDGAGVRLPGFDATSNPADERMWRAVQPALLGGGFSPPLVPELAKSLRLEERKLRDFLHRKCKTGTLFRIAENRFYPKATLATLAANAALVARSAPKGMFTAAQYRDATGIGRNLVIELLEFFDTLGITQRIGNSRKMHKNFVPILGPAKPSLARPNAKGAGAPR
jgi:selenocysteine-specific elongation factor